MSKRGFALAASCLCLCGLAVVSLAPGCSFQPSIYSLETGMPRANGTSEADHAGVAIDADTAARADAAAGGTRGAKLPVRPDAVSSVLLAAAGDVMFDRGVRTVVAEAGAGWPLSAVADIFSGADLGFVNLETALSDRGQPLPGKGIWFRSDPRFAQELRDAGISVVSLANNHSLDYGREAFCDTLAALSAVGVAACGGGRNIQEARRPAIVRKNGLVISFLAYSELAPIFWSYTDPETFIAEADRPGIPDWREDQILSDIRRAKSMSHHVIASFHWGDEYSLVPAERQVALARAAVDAGASVVLGHHPHVLQPVEVYRNGVIFYSLGNLVFDQRRAHTTDSLIALLSLTPYRVEVVQLIPVRIERCRPVPLKGWEARAAMARFAAMCWALGTDVVFAGGRGHVLLTPAPSAPGAPGAAGGPSPGVTSILPWMESRITYGGNRISLFPALPLSACGRF